MTDKEQNSETSISGDNHLKSETPLKTCRSPHSENGDPNCTGVCQRTDGHSGKHKDQHEHDY